MRTKFKIYPYSMKSKSAKALAQGLNALRVYPNKNYISKSNHIIINWGNTHTPAWKYQGQALLLNFPYNVSLACSKINTFNKFIHANVNHPTNTTNKLQALSWIEQGHKVFCRQTVAGHSGQGIIISSTIEELVDAPLYTKAIKKDKEYRVHVAGGQIIDFQQKKKQIEYEGGISGIRNHSNGWVFARQDVQLPDEVAFQSIRAVDVLGLDFGAVDICTEKNTNKPFVFEINTAPGLEGTTLTKYIKYFESLL